MSYKTTNVMLLLLALEAAPAFSQGNVHMLSYINNWTDVNLTRETGGNLAYFYSGLAAFNTTPNNQLHVYYVQYPSQHVHQLYYNNTSWVDQDLTVMARGEIASPYGLGGFALGNQQHIFYVGWNDLHVHHLSYVNSWTDQDITAAAGTGAVSTLGPVLAFATSPNNQFHVYYLQLSELLDLNQLYFNGSTWVNQDLFPDGEMCNASVWMAGFAIGNSQHIFCAGTVDSGYFANLMHVCYPCQGGWGGDDITLEVGGLSLMPGAPIAAFAYPGGSGRMEVYSVTGDNHVHQYTYPYQLPYSPWGDQDLTATIGAPADSSVDGGAVAFPTTPNDQFHMYYMPSYEIYQLYFNGTNWYPQDLTNGSGNANNNSGMAGFAIGNSQYVFYISNT